MKRETLRIANVLGILLAFLFIMVTIVNLHREDRALKSRVEALEKTTASFNDCISRAETVLGRIEGDLKRNPGSWGWATNAAKP